MAKRGDGQPFLHMARNLFLYLGSNRDFQRRALSREPPEAARGAQPQASTERVRMAAQRPLTGEARPQGILTTNSDRGTGQIGARSGSVHRPPLGQLSPSNFRARKSRLDRGGRQAVAGKRSAQRPPGRGGVRDGSPQGRDTRSGARFTTARPPQGARPGLRRLGEPRSCEKRG